MSGYEIIGLIFIIVLICLILIILVLNVLVNDIKVKVNKSLLMDNRESRVLIVLAHPDDEVMISGTIAKLVKHKHQVDLLYLTKGEDGPTGGLVEQKELGKRRLKELEKVKQTLKVSSLTVLDFPDRYLNTIPKDKIFTAIESRIKELNPEYIITFDDSIGLYGHSDHRYTGECVKELVLDHKFQVKKIFVMTLPNKMIKLALKISQTFRKNYNASNGLPSPDIAIKISAFGKKKLQVIKNHATQWEVMNDVQPLYDKIPYFIYYRIFNKEYYSIIDIKK